MSASLAARYSPDCPSTITSMCFLWHQVCSCSFPVPGHRGAHTSDAPTLETKEASSAPTPRVGTASEVLGGRMYFFSGRGGIDMAPIEEEGAVWSYDPYQASWSKVAPADASRPYPQARSYHCSTSDSDKFFFVHAGYPPKGRLSDL